MRLVFMGTPDFAAASLEELLQSGHEVAGVVTQPDRPRGRGQKLTPSPVKQVAVAHGVEVVQPENVKETSFGEWLSGKNPEAVVVVAFGQKIPPEILHFPPKGCINLHASLLPRYRGAAPINYAIINGEKVTGVTTMYMDEGWDTGDMILKREVPIGAEETAGELHDRLAVAGAGLLRETMDVIAGGTAPRVKQDSSLATYAPKVKEEDARVDWNLPAEALSNRIRGFAPRPGAWTFWQGKRVRLLRARPAQGMNHGTPGEVLQVDTRAGIITVAAGLGALDILEVQPENRGPMTAGAFAVGHGIRQGLCWGD